MATVNFDVSTAWVKLAQDVDDPLRISARDRTRMEFATTATDAAPGDVRGHVQGMGDGVPLTRASGLVGFVWGRVIAGHPDVELAVDGSSVGD